MAITLKLALCVACACTLPAVSAHPASELAKLQAVTVSSKSDPVENVSGWRDVPLSKSPFQAVVFRANEIQDRGVERLSDLSRLDPAVGDAYNAEGYWDFLSVRGYVIDNRFNYRRDGLPINAQTSIPLDNKARIEVLKGTTGLQAGISAPGGLVNLVVKRPLPETLRSATLAWRERRTLRGAIDISQRFGRRNVFGARVSASAEKLTPQTHHASGERSVLAIAGDWRLAPNTLLEAEFETSHRSQPSVPGFSLLGSRVPVPVDPRVNLNNQPWSLPVIFDATNASLRFSQGIANGWRWTAHAATQRLMSDDRVAFPFGCSAENNFDRYCSDGSFDLYDFRSENERRRTDALELALHGSVQTGGIAHTLSTGVLRSQVHHRFQGVAFNFAGTGNVQGNLITNPAASPTSDSSKLDETNTEVFLRDRVSLGANSVAWFGLRHTHRSHSGDSPPFAQDFTVPWLALSHALAPQQLIYASWGQGVESEVTPNLPRYLFRGQPLPALKSRQIEIGVKGATSAATWNLAWFDIDQPATTDTGSEFFVDGSARHRGFEAAAETNIGALTVGAGAMVLNARRRGSKSAFLNGLQPVNVPRKSIKLQGRYRVDALDVVGSLIYQGKRMVLPDNSISIGGYTRADASLRYESRLDTTTVIWRAGIDNLFDRRAWKESPFQFGHVYLFPLPARTARVSAQLTW